MASLRDVEVGVVREVEKVRPDLQTDVLGDCEPLLDRHVHYGEAGTAADVPRRVPEDAHSGRFELRRVERVSDHHGLPWREIIPEGTELRAGLGCPVSCLEERQLLTVWSPETEFPRPGTSILRRADRAFRFSGICGRLTATIAGSAPLPRIPDPASGPPGRPTGPHRSDPAARAPGLGARVGRDR